MPVTPGTTHSAGPTFSVSLGAELSLDTVVGYVLPVTFTGGVAWVSHDRGTVAFARIGRAF